MIGKVYIYKEPSCCHVIALKTHKKLLCNTSLSVVLILKRKDVEKKVKSYDNDQKVEYIYKTVN